MVNFYIWHRGAIFFVSKPNSNIIEEMDLIFDFWCFSATFSNISAMSWGPQRMCQKKTNNYGCILLHLSHIDQEHVVDELHLLMGITDALLRIVIEDAVRLDPQTVG
jgi:hypothetical protein